MKKSRLIDCGGHNGQIRFENKVLLNTKLQISNHILSLSASRPLESDPETCSITAAEAASNLRKH
jgi:hypothetical protein